MVGPPGQHVGLRVGEVAARDAAGPVDVTLGDRLGQLDMRVEHRAALGQRRVGAARRALVGPLSFVAGPQRLEAADDRDDGVIAAALDDEIVEFTADFGEEPTVVEILGHGVVDLLEFWHQGVRPVGPLGRQRGAGGLEFLQRHAQVGDLDRLALQQQTQHVGGAGLRRCVHDRAAAVAAPDRDQALGFQDPQRFAQRDQADVELLDEHLLARQEIAVGELAVDDLTAQLVGYDFGDPRRRQPATGVGTNSQGGHPILAASSRREPRRSSRVLDWLSYFSSNGINSLSDSAAIELCSSNVRPSEPGARQSADTAARVACRRDQ